MEASVSKLPCRNLYALDGAGQVGGVSTSSPSKYGIPRDHNNVRKSFGSLMKKLGIQGVKPHTCRHTAATKMMASGLAPEVVKQILGHADITTTLNIYTHPDVSLLVGGMASVNWRKPV